MKSDKNTCYYCDKPIVHYKAATHANGLYGNKRTKEHIIPRSKGGTNNSINIIWACEKCNSRRSSISIEDYYKSMCRTKEERKRVAELIEYINYHAGALYVSRKETHQRIDILIQEKALVKQAIKLLPVNDFYQFANKLQKKFPHAYSLVEPHMWRWIYDNLVCKEL